MSKKSMGLGKATDYGAAMTANAQRLMPEIANVKNMAKGGKAHHSSGKGSTKPRAMPPMLGAGALPGIGSAIPPMQPANVPPEADSGAPMMKRGGDVKKCAAGGVQKIQRGVASAAGAPIKPGKPVAPKVKFHGKAGVRGG